MIHLFSDENRNDHGKSKKKSPRKKTQKTPTFIDENKVNLKMASIGTF